MTSAPQRMRRGFACSLVVVFGGWLAGTGCALQRTSMIEELPVTSASVHAIRAAAAALSAETTTTPTRFSVSAKSGSITHSPVYFRSEIERPGTNPDLGISGNDFAACFPEAAGFFISIALHPVDALITPPWTKMESDGHQVERGATGHRTDHERG